jgi:hypothetical protein
MKQIIYQTSASVAKKYADRHTASHYALILNAVWKKLSNSLNRKEETSLLYLNIKNNYLGFVLQQFLANSQSDSAGTPSYQGDLVYWIHLALCNAKHIYIWKVSALLL